MLKPSEHKTVQSRILKYAGAIGWTFVSPEEAEQRRGFDPEVNPKDRAIGSGGEMARCSSDAQQVGLLLNEWTSEFQYRSARL